MEVSCGAEAEKRARSRGGGWRTGLLRDLNQEGKRVAPWIPVGVPMLFALAAIHGYNNLLALRHQVRNAWSPIEAQLRSRRDLVQRLVETMNPTGESEPEALEAVTRASRQALEADGIPERAGAENELSEALRGFFVMVGACPELEVNPDVRALQEELTAAEDRIAFARRSYNDQVMAWNVRIARFPWSLIARPAGLRPAEYFVMDEPGRREAPPGAS
jgi:LemA protein